MTRRHPRSTRTDTLLPYPTLFRSLELILADLRDAGLLVSRRGKLGGYHLSKPTHLVSLGEIIRIIEGPLALVPCVSRTAYRRCKDCEDEATCAIRQDRKRVV